MVSKWSLLSWPVLLVKNNWNNRISASRCKWPTQLLNVSNELQTVFLLIFNGHLKPTIAFWQGNSKKTNGKISKQNKFRQLLESEMNLFSSWLKFLPIYFVLENIIKKKKWLTAYHIILKVNNIAKIFNKDKKGGFYHSYALVKSFV